MSDKKSLIIRRRLIHISLFCCSFIAAFIALEISVRYIFPPPPHSDFFHDFSGYVVYLEDQVNELLGWVNPPDAAGNGPFGEYISFDYRGLRNNGNNVNVSDTPLVLAIGDSFTFGSEVNNADTWPSQLEAISGIKVLNGGVGGYGLGQMLTRTKLIVVKLERNIDVLIVALISEDIKRLRLKRKYKPYYTIENGALVLHTVMPGDVPTIGSIRKLLGRSYAAHLFMSKLFKDYWLAGTIYEDRVHAGIDEVEVSYRIIDEFAKMAGPDNIPFVIFVLLPVYHQDLSFSPHPVTEHINTVCKKNRHVLLLNLQMALFERRSASKFSGEREPSDVLPFFNDSSKGYHGHYSKQGNEFVAQEIYSFLQSVGACQ